MALETNLTNLWLLQANSTDSVGANDGTDTDISYSTPEVGFANFDGNSSKIVPTSAIARPTNLTIAAWIKATTGANMWIICDQNAAGSEGWGFGVRSDGKLRIFWADSGGESGFWDTDNLVIPDANLHFVAVTQVAIDGTPVIYVDGTSKPLTKVFGSGTTAPSAQGTAIGEYGAYTGGLQWFNGAMRMLGIWSRAITGAEVTTLYNGGSIPGFSGGVFTFSVIYTMETAPATFTYTPVGTTPTKIMHMITAPATFILTGIAATITKVVQPVIYYMVTVPAQFIMIGQQILLNKFKAVINRYFGKDY